MEKHHREYKDIPDKVSKNTKSEQWRVKAMRKCLQTHMPGRGAAPTPPGDHQLCSPKTSKIHHTIVYEMVEKK